MKEERHIIDLLFRNKLGNYEKPPPDEVWYSLSEQLRRKNKRSAFILAGKIAAGIALLIFAGLSWYYFSGNITSREDYITEQILVQHDKQKAPEEKEKVTDTAHTFEKTEALVTEGDGLKEFSAEPIQITQKTFSEQPEAHESVSVMYAMEETFMPFYVISFIIPEQISPPSPRPERIESKPENQSPPLSSILSEITEEVSSPFDRSGKWMLSFMAAPDYSYRTVKDGYLASSEYFNNSESATVNMAGGIQAGYRLSKRLDLQSGIFYSRSGVEINNLNIKNSAVGLSEYLGRSDSYSAKSVINTANSIGKIIHENPDVIFMSYNSSDYEQESTREVNQEHLVAAPNMFNQVDAGLIQYFDFIEFPLNLRYLIYDGDINLNVIGGFSSNILIGNKVFYSSETEKFESGKTENIRTLNYSGNIGLNIDYRLSDHILILLEPRYKHFLRSVNHEGLLDARPYMFGVFTGVRYRF